MRYDAILIVFSVFILWGFYLWRFKYKEHFHNPNWTMKEYLQHIKEKHPDIRKEYGEDDKK